MSDNNCQTCEHLESEHYNVPGDTTCLFETDNNFCKCQQFKSKFNKNISMQLTPDNTKEYILWGLKYHEGMTDTEMVLVNCCKYKTIGEVKDILLDCLSEGLINCNNGLLSVVKKDILEELEVPPAKLKFLGETKMSEKDVIDIIQSKITDIMNKSYADLAKKTEFTPEVVDFAQENIKSAPEKLLHEKIKPISEYTNIEIATHCHGMHLDQATGSKNPYIIRPVGDQKPSYDSKKLNIWVSPGGYWILPNQLDLINPDQIKAIELKLHNSKQVLASADCQNCKHSKALHTTNKHNDHCAWLDGGCPCKQFIVDILNQETKEILPETIKPEKFNRILFLE